MDEPTDTADRYEPLRRRARTRSICPYCLDSGGAETTDGRTVPCSCGQPMVQPITGGRRP